MDFKSLKKNKGNLSDLQQRLENDKTNSYDDRSKGFWKLTVDKAKNGYAVIRFLPAPPGEEYPYVRLYSHSFKNPKTGKWYIEDCLTTIDKPDPVAEMNSLLWNEGGEEGKKQARLQKRKLQYISNILVVHDPANPENDGKVFKFSYGARIFQKIEGALNPEFEDEQAFNPFDYWEGANFKLKARQLDGQRSYDKSGFEEPSALFDGDDEALEKLHNELPSLAAEVAPEKFKDYDKLKARLDLVLGNNSAANEVRQQVLGEEREEGESREEPRREVSQTVTVEDEDDSEAIAKYRALLQNDDE